MMNQAHKKRWFKIFLMIYITLIGTSFDVLPAYAKNKKNIEPHVLIVYSSPSGEVGQEERILDMLIGHFTVNIVFKQIAEVQTEDLKTATHLFYFGERKEVLPESFRNILESFTGAFIALGYNVDQLGTRFSFLKPIGEESFSRIAFSGKTDKELNVFPQTVLNVSTTKETQVMIKASHGPKNEYPFMMKHNENYYFASAVLNQQLAIFLAEALHEVFHKEHVKGHTGYIRLEDVHPKTNPQILMEIAEVLKERNIPYMIAVIPVYVNKKSNKEYHLSDSPELLKVLRYMQDHGGSIVLHGYTHQFRSSETGEGFEFWDVEHNMPIYHTKNDEVVKKTESDFDSKLSYQLFRKAQIAYETSYVETKLEKGIQELANYGLYPLAFEAPHYTMSQNGYAVTSHFFSTYVGQLQTSDQDWRMMNTAPYTTKPAFLKGMQLLPETIGYVEQGDRMAIEKMLKNAKENIIVRDGMITGFYHPYLGVKGLMHLLDELEKIPGIKWIDLKKVDTNVQSKYVKIETNNGDIHLDINRGRLYLLSADFFFFHVKELVKHVMWGMVGAGALAVILFIVYTLFVTVRRGRFG